MAGDLGKKKMEILKELFDNLPTDVNTEGEFKKFIEEHESYLNDIHVPGGIWEKDNVITFLKENFSDENNIIDEFKNMSELVNEHVKGLVIETDDIINDLSTGFVLKTGDEKKETTTSAQDTTEVDKIVVTVIEPTKPEVNLIEKEILNNCSLDLVKDELITFFIKNIGVALKIELGTEYNDLIKSLSLLDDVEVIKTVNDKLKSFSDIADDEDVKKLFNGLSEKTVLMIMKRIILEDVISFKKQNNPLIICNEGNIKLLKKYINDFLSNSKEIDQLQLLNFFKVNKNLFNANTVQSLHNEALTWYATVRTKFNDTCISGLPDIFIMEYNKFKKKKAENKKSLDILTPIQPSEPKPEKEIPKMKDIGDVFVSEDYLKLLFKGARF